MSPSRHLAAQTAGTAHSSAMILAAGRGERMRPLTDHMPKPLLRVRGKPLMQWPLEALARGGFDRVLINTAWLGEQIAQTFGNRFNGAAGEVGLRYSHEGQDFGRALETAGGVARALPHLEPVFWLWAGDVYAPEFAASRSAYANFLASSMLAHLWLVPNPSHHPAGDFGIAQGLALAQAPLQWTYSGIGLYRRALFAPPFCQINPGNPEGVSAKLAPVLRAAMAQGRVSATLYHGPWTDVGTPERLRELNANPERSHTSFE